MSDAELKDRFKAEMTKLAEQPPFTLQLTPLEAYCVLANLQLAFKHPANLGPATEFAKLVAKRIQNLVAPRGTALREVSERAWPEGA